VKCLTIGAGFIEYDQSGEKRGVLSGKFENFLEW